MNFKRKYSQLQNENPNATIGFLITYPFFFFIHKNIYKYLKKESEFIIDLTGSAQTMAFVGEVLKDTPPLLNKHGVNFRILFPEDLNSHIGLKKFFSKYKVLVSPWEFRGALALPETKHIKKINTPYGPGKELSKLRPTRGMFDLIFACGPREKTLFSYYTRSEIIGVPKFDDWFNNSLDKDFLSQVKNKLDPNKKTILHLPTHGDLAETYEVIDKIAALTKTYNVITKIHYFTLREEPEMEGELTKRGIIVFKDVDDILCLLKVADMVMADNSSAIFDAILADKPVLLSQFLTDDYLDNVHRAGLLYKRGRGPAATYSGSIEQEIKKKGLVPVFKKEDDLQKKVKEVLKDKKFFRKSRKEIRKQVFSLCDGMSGKRASTIIKKIQKEKKSPPRPILYHIIDTYVKSLQEQHKFFKRKLG